MYLPAINTQHYWIDNLNPWIFHITGNLGLRWYGAAYAAGFLIAAWMFTRWAHQGRLPIAREEVSTLILYTMIGIIAGGRLGYCLFYNLDEVLRNPLEIFAVWHGGMASHGGILGLITALCLYAHQQRLSPWPFLDAASVIGPIGIFFGRIANFINGELWGHPATVPWAVIFPQAPYIHGINVPRHPSQLYAALIEGLLTFAVTQYVYHRRSHPGTTTATLLIAYGIGRFIDEFWREPDLGQPIFFGWMSKGQLLTISVIAAGLMLAVWRQTTLTTTTQENTQP